MIVYTLLVHQQSKKFYTESYKELESVIVVPDSERQVWMHRNIAIWTIWGNHRPHDPDCS